MDRVLITNGGPHSAEKWAEATADMIVEVADHVVGEKRNMAIKLQAAIVGVLEAHHHTVQHGERAKIKEHGHGRLSHPLSADDHLSVDAVADQVIDVAKGTPWEAAFAELEFKEHLKVLLWQHFHTSMHIERSWHADRNPDAPEAHEFKKRHSIGGVK